MLVGLLAVGDAIRHEPAGWIARLGWVFGVCATAVAAALQAVDGIALKVTVDYWSSAPLDQRQSAFMAAFAVRQIEVGLASFVGMLFGVTAILCGIAMAWSKGFPAWLGWLGVVGGVGTVAGGLLSAHTGFSAIAMDVAMPFNLLIVIWMIPTGVVLWRRCSIPIGGRRGALRFGNEDTQLR